MGERHGLYGAPPRELAEPPAGALQFSPLVAGAADLAEEPDGALAGLTMLAPPGTAERRYALAQGLRATAPGGRIVVLAPKDKGGSRLGKELKAFGLDVAEEGRRHHRICTLIRPAEAQGLAAAIAEGGPRLDPKLGLWTQPGVFAWDRIDPGTALLLKTLPDLTGKGADLGCGLGVLAHRVLSASGVTALTLVDLDRRAVEAARRNVQDPRATVLQADARGYDGASGLDFVVMNPPFHDGGAEDRALGQGFIATAARLLRSGGTCWLVANRHLPYEAPLAAAFAAVKLRAEADGFKVYEARK